MRTKSEHISPAHLLALQWFALWHAVSEFAYGVSLTKKFDPPRAAREAAKLEVWTRFALFSLIAEIAAIETGDTPLSLQDRTHLSHARGIVGALAMLCALAAKMKRGSLARMNGFVHGAVNQSPARHNRVAALPQQHVDISYLDSS